MGLALLNQAFSKITSLDSTYPLKDLQESRESCGNQLMGAGSAFTCSAIISLGIFRELNSAVRDDTKAHLQNIVNASIPDPWKPDITV